MIVTSESIGEVEKNKNLKFKAKSYIFEPNLFSVSLTSKLLWPGFICVCTGVGTEHRFTPHASDIWTRRHHSHSDRCEFSNMFCFSLLSKTLNVFLCFRLGADATMKELLDKIITISLFYLVKQTCFCNATMMNCNIKTFKRQQ